VLDLAARGDVLLQSDAENALAQILAGTAPKSDVLLGPCVRRFGWDKRESDLAQDRAVLSVLGRWRDLEMLTKLRSGSDPQAAAYARLCRPEDRLRRWWRANVTDLHRSPELPLLTLLKDHHPALLGELNPAQLAWWEQFQESPKPSYALLRIGRAVLTLMWAYGLMGLAVLVLLCLEFGVKKGLAQIPWRAVFVLVLVSVTAFVLLLLSKLYLIDWPVLLVKRRWPEGPPLPLQAGWLPMLIAMFGIVVMLRQSTQLAWVALLIGAAGCVWATYVSGPLEPFVRPQGIVPANSRILQALLQNAVLASWWLLALHELDSHPGFSFDARTIAALCLMCAVSFGSRALDAAWTERLTALQRRLFSFPLAVLALPLAATIEDGITQVSRRPLEAWMLVTFIVLHRIPCLRFSERQRNARWMILAGCLLVSIWVWGAAAPSGELDSLDAPVMQVGGLALMMGALANLCMAFHNQLQGRA
jgi:hypothetical protein